MMDHIGLYALLSTLVVSLLSFVGAFLFFIKTKTLQLILLLLICFSIGALLGNAFFHLIPESYFHLPSAHLASWLILAGFLLFFIIDQVLRVHTNTEPHTHTDSHASGIKPYGYLSLYADGIHNFTDGILIGAAWMVMPELGLATTLAIIMHEIPQEVSDIGILIRAGFSKRKALLFNFVIACAAILGTALTLWLGHHVGHLSTYILPVAAGGFIYLAAGSLLPEILKETAKRNLLLHLVVILSGLGLMYYLSLHSGHHH
ncbi:ZIP family metal transporter [uncultured Proteiniphilum sp.]|uniref:ZIP family metal transporter n=1 Tax=uncultured Proteiniphilum sp. TaxID=497637 RepID=UPI0026205B2A|nr:ZIP family metal transporter [uncultured Proteiniphilum sp.]